MIFMTRYETVIGHTIAAKVCVAQVLVEKELQ